MFLFLESFLPSPRKHEVVSLHNLPVLEDSFLAHYISALLEGRVVRTTHLPSELLFEKKEPLLLAGLSSRGWPC